MKNVNVKILILMLFVFISSCTRIYVRLMGFKPPHLETEETLIAYMKKDSIDINSAYYAKDSLSDIKLQSLQRMKGKILIFNKNGFLNIYAEKAACSGPVENYLNGICNRQPLYTDSIVKLDSTFALLQSFSQSQINQNPDLTILIFWTVYWNKNNKDLYAWDSVLKKQHDCNINIFFVNIDFMAKDYGYKKRTKLRSTYSGHKAAE